MVLDSLDLVPFTRDHFDDLIRWSPTPEFLLQWAGPSFQHPLDREQLESLLATSPPARLYTPTLDGRPIGHAELGRVHPEAGHASVMRVLIGDPTDRGHGIGREIVRRLAAIAFDEMGLAKLYLHVLRGNEPAVRCYRGLGFVDCEPIVPRDLTRVQGMVLTADAAREPGRPD
jgi:RimJ/RimL family protein N-acetyltransferase